MLRVNFITYTRKKEGREREGGREKGKERKEERKRKIEKKKEELIQL